MSESFIPKKMVQTLIRHVIGIAGQGLSYRSAARYTAPSAKQPEIPPA